MKEDKDFFESEEIEISDKTFLELSKIAHNKDITFNQLCNDILKEFFIKYDNYIEIKNFLEQNQYENN